jgi:hypothetical protein
MSMIMDMDTDKGHEHGHTDMIMETARARTPGTTVYTKFGSIQEEWIFNYIVLDKLSHYRKANSHGVSTDLQVGHAGESIQPTIRCGLQLIFLASQLWPVGQIWTERK